MWARATFLGVVFFGIALGAWAGEMRVWQSADGSHKTKATLLKTLPTAVLLEKEDGKQVEVPLEKLSDVDREYVKQLHETASPQGGETDSSAQSGPAGAKESALKTLERDALRCRTAKEAYQLYQMYLADADVSAEAKAAALPRLEFWQDAARRDQIRYGTKWVTLAELNEANRTVESLIREGLDFLGIDNTEMAQQKFQEASRANPDDTQADSLMGLLHAVGGRDYPQAREHFQECVRRDPNSVPSLINVALVEAMLDDYQASVEHFQAAASLDPRVQELGHNLARILDCAGGGSLPIPKPVLKDYSDLYTEVRKAGGTSRQAKVGWIYALPSDSSQRHRHFRADDFIVTEGGSGVIVAPQHVLTTRHVIDGAGGISIYGWGEARAFPATVVATSEQADLALLRCEHLQGPPLPLHEEIPDDGTRIMLLGFPATIAISTPIESGRGVILRTDAVPADEGCFYNLVAKPGYSGGPIFDAYGRVLAIHSQGSNLGARLSTGIPSRQALELVRSQLENYQNPPAAKSSVDWSRLGNYAKQATVLILRKDAKTGPLKIGGNSYTKWVEDRGCVHCRGNGRIPCTHRDCHDGTLIRNNVSVKCPVCEGQGTLDCPRCLDGQDRDL